MDDIGYAIDKVPEKVNRKFPPRNRTVQLSSTYTDLELHYTHRHRKTDKRQIDRRQYHENSGVEIQGVTKIHNFCTRFLSYLGLYVKLAGAR